MGLGRIIIAGVIASIAIFAVSVVQSYIIAAGGWAATFTGAIVFVAPAIVGATVFVAVLGKLQEVQV